jgi:hypothetical protein
LTFDHHAVHGHLVAWNHAQPVADFDLVERDFLIAPRRDPPGRGRRQVQQGPDGAARAAAGTEFEHLTEQHQHHDHRGGLEVDGNLAVVLHRMREQAGHEHRRGAKDECGAHADGNQREHVQVTRHDGTPAALDERPACPPDHRRGECELQPTRDVAIDPRLPAQCRDQVGHRQKKHRQRQHGTDPESRGHVAQFGVVLFVRARRHRLRFQRHAALGAIARMILLDFRMHRTRVKSFALRLLFAICVGRR